MKAVATYQKLRGGYYTPKLIADFLAQWAIQTPTTTVLEPSCGDGTILTSAAETLLKCGAEPIELTNLIQGIELDQDEAQKAIEQIQTLTGIHTLSPVAVGDFFKHCQNYLAQNRYFDAIVGNPPFIRYQNFPEHHRAIT